MSDPFEALAASPRNEPVVLMHSCGAGPAFLYRDAVDVCRVGGDAAAHGLEALGSFLETHRGRRCAGWLGYDLRDAVESLPRRIEASREFPTVFVAAFDRVEEFAETRIPGLDALGDVAATAPHAPLTREQHEANVASVVESIRAGDLFQANVTQPFTARYDGDPRRLFERLCAVSPAPFAAYCDDGQGCQVLSSSPEEFVSVENGVARSRPIKGTRPRDADPERDAALLEELLTSEKDQAELAMIVDLMRNDLGKVARIGGVSVGPFPEHATFAQVHHLFATVRAELRDDVELIDVLRATFPAGSITGAPKLRSMEILEELEVERREVYTGAVGWFGPERSMHLSVAIRTMTLRDGVVRFDAGGGITADSEPSAEYEETLHKAAGMARALQVPWPPGDGA